MLKELIHIVQQAGALLLAARGEKLDVTEKTGPRDLVTQYDTQIQEYLRSALMELLPEAGFLAEEAGFDRPDREKEWVFIVDPIDGTTNFIQGFQDCCVSVALAQRGAVRYGVVYAPFSQELYYAKQGEGAYLGGRRLSAPDRDLAHSLLLFGSGSYYRELVAPSLAIFSAAFPLVQDVRRFGSAALDLCYLAAGRAGVFYECRLCPWDYAAGSLIAREAGVNITNLKGGELDLWAKDSVLAGAPAAYAAMKALTDRALAERSET